LDIIADNTQDLPQQIPIFPLSNVLLLPRAQLPLNIFESKYLAMVNDAFQNGRIIGMVQPCQKADCGPSDIYMTGCAGRITQMEDPGNGNYFITLTGVSRFDIIKEVDRSKPYRQIIADWAPYKNDLKPVIDPCFDTTEFLDILERYFIAQNMKCDKWDEMKDIPAEKLVATLAMVCPFSAQEKQAILEAPCFAQRSELLITLMEMSLQQHASAAQH